MVRITIFKRIDIRQRILPLTALVLIIVLTGCSGLSGEPPTVSTLIPSTDVPPTSIPAVAATNTNNSTQVAVAQPAATQEAARPGATREATATVEVPGTVTGTITNGTSGATVPPNMAVTLHLFDINSDSETKMEGTADAAGAFRFDKVPISKNLSYLVTTIYNTRMMGSDFVTGDPAVTAMTMPVKLYELTSDPSVVSITNTVTRVVVDASGMQVAQIIHMTDTADRAFTSTNAVSDTLPVEQRRYPSVTIALPHGASLMGFSDSSGRFVMAPDGSSFTDTQAILPGEDHLIHFIYSLPYNENSTVIDQPLGYAMNGPAQLIIQPPEIGATTSLTSLGIQDNGTSKVQSYGSAVTLKAGESLHFELHGKLSAPSATTTTSAPVSRDLLIGILIGGGLGLIVVGIIFLVRERLTTRRPASGNAKTPSADELTTNPEMAHLVEELAKLDERFEKGKISKTVYEQRRADLKIRLADLMK